jgi:antitoxin ParD1/3/4
MTVTMNISLPEDLREYVDEQVTKRSYTSNSEYLRELIRKDRDIEYVRGLLLAGAASPLGDPIDASYFESLRAEIRQS